MIRQQLPLAAALAALACSTAPDPSLDAATADAGPREVQGPGGQITPNTDPAGWDGGPGPDPAFATDASFPCCPVTFAWRATTAVSSAGVRLRGGDFPLNGDGVPMAASQADPQVWLATACMPPTYRSYYYFELLVPDDERPGESVAVAEVNPYSPIGDDPTIGPVNVFEPAATCAELDTAPYALTSAPDGG